jgi:endonuclease YncB( thermonuclease family)
MLEDDYSPREDKGTSYTLGITLLLMAVLVIAAWALKRGAGEKSTPPPAQTDKGQGTGTGSAEFPAIPVGEDGKPKSDYQVITDCRLVEDPGNDGDSFRVHTPQGTFPFRLYWVEAVPLNGGSPDVIREFSDHFEVKTEERLRELATEAKEFTVNTLRSVHFRVVTKWEKDATGAALCFVYASDADAAQPRLQNLALLLVQNGLALIRPATRALPEAGTAPGDFQNQLTAAEAEAKRLLCGGWAKKEG